MNMAGRKEIFNFNPNENFHYYIYWMCERMSIFWQRYYDFDGELTDDPILQEFKFTNVYRCLDRVSNYLIGNVIYDGKEREPENIFARILLFKHFNKIETWEAIEKNFGEVNIETLYDPEVPKFLKAQKDPIYSNAYIVTPYFYKFEKYQYLRGWEKCDAYFDIFRKEIFENGLMYKILDSKTMEELFNNFLSLDIYGDFIAQQYTIDMMYSPLVDFDENEFIVAGPGAKRGIGWTFDITGKPNYSEIIKWVHANFWELVDKYGEGVEFLPLPNREPTLIDLQNCFCETSKYSKGLGNRFNKKHNERIKNTFKPNKNKIIYKFPPKWGISL